MLILLKMANHTLTCGKGREPKYGLIGRKRTLGNEGFAVAVSSKLGNLHGDNQKSNESQPGRTGSSE